MTTDILQTDQGEAWISETGSVGILDRGSFAHDLAREIVRLLALLEQQRQVNIELTEQLRACAEVLGKAAWDEMKAETGGAQ